MVTVAWDDASGRYVLRNRSSHAVLVCFRTRATLIRTILSPGEMQTLEAPDFEYPFSATYL
jgi:hypothetical protein